MKIYTEFRGAFPPRCEGACGAQAGPQRLKVTGGIHGLLLKGQIIAVDWELINCRLKCHACY